LATEPGALLSSTASIGADLIPDHVRTAPSFRIPNFVVPPEGLSFKDVITNVERRLIESTLEAAGGVQKKAAELLKIKPTTLNEMIKRHDIRPRRKRPSTGGRNGADAPEMDDLADEGDEVGAANRED
jgi:DNA-binding NtrC family response regulator